MNNVLVTGGSGFLGLKIAEALHLKGYSVSILDKNLPKHRNEKFNYIQADILDKDKITNIISKTDIVYHMAGIADIEESDNKPYDTIQCNVIGSTNIIEACAIHNKKIMFASTVYVYSQLGSFYRVSKQSAEIILEAYSKKFNLDYTILRYGSLYGPMAQDWNGVKKYISEILNKNQVIIAGTGDEKREYIHINDAAVLSITALDKKYSCKAVSITGTQVLTLKELTDIICEIIGKKIHIKFDTSIKTREHYQLTPYQYTPKHSIKLIANEYTDIGQGILEIIEETDKFN